MNKKVLIFLSIIFQTFVFILLATGSSLLVKPVLGGALPWGNLLTAMLLVLFPLNFLVFQRSSIIPFIPLMIYRGCVYLGILLGAGWLFVSYALAGNWSTTFQGGDVNQRIWTYYTYTAAVLPFAGYFLMRILSGFFKK